MLFIFSVSATLKSYGFIIAYTVWMEAIFTGSVQMAPAGS